MNFARFIKSLPVPLKIFTCTLSTRATRKLESSSKVRNWTEFKSALPLSHLTAGSIYVPVRNAGHSKWANIKHTKMSKDLEKSREITKFCQMIRVAIKEKGSADPKLNKALADALDRAKEARVPLATINKTLDATKNIKELKNLTWHVKGPGQSVFILEILTDHVTRCKGEIVSIVKKNHGVLADEGVMYQFEYKGIILSTMYDGKPVSEEQLDTTVAHAIEADAEEVTFQTYPDYGNVFEFVTDPANFFKVKHSLLKMNYTLVDSDLRYIPLNPVQLTDIELDAATKLCDKLLAHTDIVKLSDNIAAS